MALTLVIGNKNYSSWSMRPWVALKACNIAFDEVSIPLYTGDADKQRILKFSRSGKVPVLVDGDITVWDSLAIIEYAAERFPAARLGPRAPAQPRRGVLGVGENAFGLRAAAKQMRNDPAWAGRRKGVFGRCAR